MGKYFDNLKSSMTMLGKHDKTIFVGQSCRYKGTAMTTTLINVPDEKKIEMPIAEELQMGISIGLALEGYIPISIYPRWNFLLLAVNQLVNHLDKLPIISSNGYSPGVIIRVGVGSQHPLFPGHQHIGDFTDQFNDMCKNMWVIRLTSSSTIEANYNLALKRAEQGVSSILVELSDLYND